MSIHDENSFIDWIRAESAKGKSVVGGIGDDCAQVGTTKPITLVTVDMLIEGVHFDLGVMTPEQVGRKALAVNLSDIAAMAGEPTAGFVALAIPRARGADLAVGVMRGVFELAREFDVAIAGGDTNSVDGPLVISLTLLGTPTQSGAVTRAGARPEDVVCVTGSLGYSLSGKHWSFTPRVHEAIALHRSVAIHAMMDLSDGLASDLFKLGEESGVGFEIDADALPIAPISIDDGRSPLDHALHDGEDFELLFTVTPDDAERLREFTLTSGCPVTVIGRVVETKGCVIVDRDGRQTKLMPGGFTHRW